MTSIYLIRHAQAEGNLYRICQGQYDSILTDRGWRQVQALEKRFAGVEIDGVYASDLYRTCATATALSRPRRLPIRRRQDLREICVGVWEQRTWGDIARTEPGRMEDFTLRPQQWHVEGAEWPLVARDRVLAALGEIARENEGKTVAVFSHGYVLRLSLAALQGISLEDLAKTPVGDNTAVSLLRWNGTDWRVMFRDNSGHLQTPDVRPRRRASGLEPGLWFRPLELPRQAELMEDLVAPWWTEGVFDRARLLADAGRRWNLLGLWGEEPAGLLQMGPETGWISLLSIREDCRKRGFGVQLIGQAVQRTRLQGGETLRTALAGDSPARPFFLEYGFVSKGSLLDGRELLEKDIGFDWGILGKLEKI